MPSLRGWCVFFEPTALWSHVLISGGQWAPSLSRWIFIFSSLINLFSHWLLILGFSPLCICSDVGLLIPGVERPHSGGRYWSQVLPPAPGGQYRPPRSAHSCNPLQTYFGHIALLGGSHLPKTSFHILKEWSGVTTFDWEGKVESSEEKKKMHVNIKFKSTQNQNLIWLRYG